MLRISKYVIRLTVLILLTNPANAQQKFNAKTAHQWVKNGTWKNGLRLNLYSSCNEVEFANQYNSNKTAWDKAIDFLRDRNLDLIAVGKYPIDGDNVFAVVTEAPSKEFDDTKWEAHKRYIDLQYVIKGKEKIGLGPADSTLVTTPYDPVKDVANYDVAGNYFIATPKVFFLFFPGDAHRPSIKVNGYDVVKKLVIKIKTIN
jgi:YhcH/YjgK/YiaL family protein